MADHQRPGKEAVPKLYRLIYALLKPIAQMALKVIPEKSRKEWFGSDAFARYTAAYTWQANQFGHFAIGILLYSVSSMLGALAYRAVAKGVNLGSCLGADEVVNIEACAGGLFWTALIIAGVLWLVYVVKETADAVMEEPKKVRVFQLNLREMAEDGATDAFFVLFGIVAALYGMWGVIELATKASDGPIGWFWTIVFAACVVVTISRARSYLPEKRRFDRSCLPYYFRLARFEGALDGQTWRAPDSKEDLDQASAAAALEEAIGAPNSIGVIALSGPPGAGKTTVAMGVGCGLGIRGHQVRYLNAREIIAERDPRPDCCPLAEADALIIDDVEANQVATLFTAIKDKIGEKSSPLLVLACSDRLDPSNFASAHGGQGVSGLRLAPWLALHIKHMRVDRGVAGSGPSDETEA